MAAKHASLELTDQHRMPLGESSRRNCRSRSTVVLPPAIPVNPNSSLGLIRRVALRLY
jgi:hypothetical protein